MYQLSKHTHAILLRSIYASPSEIKWHLSRIERTDTRVYFVEIKFLQNGLHLRFRGILLRCIDVCATTVVTVNENNHVYTRAKIHWNRMDSRSCYYYSTYIWYGKWKFKFTSGHNPPIIVDNNWKILDWSSWQMPISDTSWDCISEHWETICRQP